ncbi:hypothetical protein C3L33_22046, partial [Rhododendron williamsianum]
MKKPLKSADKGALDQKVYARHTIRNISNILRSSSWDSAQEQLKDLSVRWDSYTVNQVLKTHPPLEKAWLFFNWASGLKDARERDQIDAVTCTSLMHWLSKDGDVDGAIKVWEDMKTSHCHPTVVSFTAYMKVLFDHNRVKDAADVYKEMLQSGCSPNCYTYTVLMEHLAGSGKYGEVIEIFNKMQEAGVQPDKATCNILVQKFCKTSETWPITHILRYMKENSLVLRYPAYMEALETLKMAEESDALLRQHDDKNTQLDHRIISSIIELNSDHSRPNGALLAFEYSVKMGLRIGRPAYLALLGVFIRTNSFPKVVDVVEEMNRAGISLGTYLGSLLIYRLGCARKPASCAKIFDLLPDDQKNTATYTALIVAYFSSGKANKGLEVFTAMRNKGIDVALGTYNVLLAGLEKSGRVQELEQFRKEKKNVHADGNGQGMVPWRK